MALKQEIYSKPIASKPGCFEQVIVTVVSKGQRKLRIITIGKSFLITHDSNVFDCIVDKIRRGNITFTIIHQSGVKTSHTAPTSRFAMSISIKS